MSETIRFSNESNNERQLTTMKKWKILIADDEKEVHTVTKMVLADLEFQGQQLQFFSAYSAQQTVDILKTHPDMAIVLLDVVMETDDAGLKVVKTIREDLHNSLVRIILRTGQPGMAPEHRIITEYDINDYKEKTELTTQKLITSIISGLRSYRDLRTIERNKEGLKQIVKATGRLFVPKAIHEFIDGVIIQLTSLLYMDESALCRYISALVALDEQGIVILGGSGRYADCINKEAKEVVDENVLEKLLTAIHKKETLFFEYEYIGYFKAASGAEYLLYMLGLHPLSVMDKELLSLFTLNIATAFDNISILLEHAKNEETMRSKMSQIENLNSQLENTIQQLKHKIREYEEK